MTSLLTIDDARAHLNLTDAEDGPVLTRAIAAAYGWVSAYLGVDAPTVNDEAPYGLLPPEDEDSAAVLLKPTVAEAVLLLVGHFYENREGSLIGVTADLLPLGVHDLLMPYRNWCF